MGLLTRLRRRARPDAFDPPYRPPRVAPVGERLTTSRQDARLRRIGASGQQDAYLVLSEEERARGFVRPVRRSYIHTTCGAVTTMGQAIAETYARDPRFYSGTFCAACGVHRPVAEFVWATSDGRIARPEQQVGS